MKKIITLITTLIAVSMLSSCIIVGTEDEPEIIIKDKATTVKVGTDSSSTQQPAQQTQVVTQPQQTTTVVSQPVNTAKYSITCRNQTDMTVTDWCVSKDNIVTYANSSFNRAIGPNKEDKIQNLPTGYYKVYFSFDHDYPLSPTDYLSSDSIQLDKDVIYTLFVRTSGYPVECRSAGTPAPRYYLAGSDGSEIDLF